MYHDVGCVSEVGVLTNHTEFLAVTNDSNEVIETDGLVAERKQQRALEETRERWTSITTYPADLYRNSRWMGLAHGICPHREAELVSLRHPPACVSTRRRPSGLPRDDYRVDIRVRPVPAELSGLSPRTAAHENTEPRGL